MSPDVPSGYRFETRKLDADLVLPRVPEDIGRMMASVLTDDNRWIGAPSIEVLGGQVT